MKFEGPDLKARPFGNMHLFGPIYGTIVELQGRRKHDPADIILCEEVEGALEDGGGRHLIGPKTL